MAAMQTQHHRAAASAALGGSSSRSLGTNTLTRSQSGRGGFSASLPSTTAAATSPKDGHRRGSFMSILRRNRKAAGIQRSEPTESAARRDTKLERNADQLRDLRAASPKLQKRNNSLRRGESWPLPEDVSAVQRPGTSAGGSGSVTPKATGSGLVAAAAMAAAAAAPSPRPGTSRRNTDLGLPTTGARGRDNDDDDYSVSIASGAGSEARVHAKQQQQHKKKKFGALRRMFRLDD